MNFVKRSMFRRGLSGVVVLVAIVGMGLYFWKGPGKATRFGQFLGSEPGHGRTEGETYYCPMHTTYKSDKPGNCPICGMKLNPIRKQHASPAASANPIGTAAGGETDHRPHAQPGLLPLGPRADQHPGPGRRVRRPSPALSEGRPPTLGAHPAPILLRPDRGQGRAGQRGSARLPRRC